jgi:putative heme transporter
VSVGCAPARPVRIGLAVASVVLAVGLLAVVLPRLLGVGWSEIATTLGAIPAASLALIVVLWLAGLLAYTFVVTATLPTLSTGRAFAMNAAGAAMANLLPLGGAAGAVLTFAMARDWGHDRASVVASAVVSNTWNVLARLLLPAVGLAVLLVSGSTPNTAIAVAAAVGAAACGVGAAALAASLWSAEIAIRTGRLVDSAARLLPERIRPAPGRTGDRLRRLRLEIIGTVRGRWAELTLAMTATVVLQGALFAACLYVSDADPGLPATVAAFAVSRALTVVVATPNGVGISETGTAATLVALGAPPVPAAAAVLLFGLITHVFEIALGGLATLGWWSSRYRRVRS